MIIYINFTELSISRTDVEKNNPIAIMTTFKRRIDEKKRRTGRIDFLLEGLSIPLDCY